MATGTVHLSKTSRRLPWRLLIVIAAAVAFLAWYFWPRTSVPQLASKHLVESVVDQDYEWIFSHSFPEERAIKGFSKELIAQFCADHLAELNDAVIVSGFTTYLDEPARGIMETRVKLKNGKQITMGALGYGEDGKMLVGAMEGLVIMLRRLDYQLGRERVSWAALRPWFNEHGVKAVYMSQSGEVFDLDKAKVPDPRDVKPVDPSKEGDR